MEHLDHHPSHHPFSGTLISELLYPLWKWSDHIANKTNYAKHYDSIEYWYRLNIRKYLHKISSYSIIHKFNLYNWNGDFLLADRIMMVYRVQLQYKISNN